MRQNIEVFIIEDDFRIAEIHKKYIEQIPGFLVVGTAKTGEEALAFLAETKKYPSLIVLDVYIPDTEHLELFWQLKRLYCEIDIMIISAANEVTTISQAL